MANDSALIQGRTWGDFENAGLRDVYLTVNDFEAVKRKLYLKILEMVNLNPALGPYY